MAWGGLEKVPDIKEDGKALLEDIKNYPAVNSESCKVETYKDDDADKIRIKAKYVFDKGVKKLGFFDETDTNIFIANGDSFNELGGVDGGEGSHFNKYLPKNFEKLLNAYKEQHRLKGTIPTITIDGVEYALKDPEKLSKDAYEEITKQPWVDEEKNILKEPIV